MNSHPRVNVLLSTYNGERFIVDLLDSLFQQRYSNIAIYIRDDGSTDSTVDLIKSRIRNNKSITFTTADNVGVTLSFLKLLANSGGLSDLYAFCDQDDVWKPDKITRAVEKIMEREEPDRVLYCSRQEYVDDKLNSLGFSLIPRLVGFNNAVVENIAIGCTTVFGEAIRQLVLKGRTDNMIMHDWWAYLVASAFGEVIYDDVPSVLYRQHGHTFTAWEPGHTKLWNRAYMLMNRLRQRKHKGLDSLNQSVRFLNTYPDVPDDTKRIVNTLIEFRGNRKLWPRLRYFMHPEVIRTDPLENVALKMIILFGFH